MGGSRGVIVVVVVVVWAEEEQLLVVVSSAGVIRMEAKAVRRILLCITRMWVALFSARNFVRGGQIFTEHGSGNLSKLKRDDKFRRIMCSFFIFITGADVCFGCLRFNVVEL